MSYGSVTATRDHSRAVPPVSPTVGECGARSDDQVLDDSRREDLARLGRRRKRGGDVAGGAGDVVAGDLESGPFDLALERLVLIHLPERGLCDVRIEAHSQICAGAI